MPEQGAATQPSGKSRTGVILVRKTPKPHIGWRKPEHFLNKSNDFSKRAPGMPEQGAATQPYGKSRIGVVLVRKTPKPHIGLENAEALF